MKIAVILNPAAGNGRAGGLQQKLAQLLAASGLQSEILLSRSGDHAMALATQATAWADHVTAVGGDGTMHHVAKGIVASKKEVALGLIPVGTGNDFVKMTGTPVHIESAIKILANRKRKAVDYGTVRISTHRGDEQRYFINSLGMGFDAEVGHRASSFKVLPGFLAYLAALLSTLRKLQKVEARIILGNQTENFLYRGAILLCCVGNGHTSGGLFKLTPGATIDDGWLDVCAIESISVPKLLMSVPKVLRGAHTTMREYHAGKAKKVIISLNQAAMTNGLPVHADGEIVAHDVQRLEVQIIEKGISVIVG